MDRVTIPPINSLEAAAGFRGVGRSDVGRARSENQDFMGLFRTQDRVLAVLADGMGGHSGGYEASRITVDAMRSVMLDRPNDPPTDVLRAGIELAHKRIVDIAEASPDLKGMGTTVVAALVTNGTAWVAHVGDSRAYAVRKGVGYLQTLDHSRVHRMLLEGMIKAEQVANHPMGHILERSVGASPVLEADVRMTPIPLQKGDRIVLMSDGVWSIVNDEEIARIVSLAPLPLAAETLLGVALTRMADDNSTVMILEAAEGGPAAPLEDVRAKHGLFAGVPKTETLKVVPAAAAKPAGGIPKMWIGVGIAAVVLGLAAWLMIPSSEPTEDSASDADCQKSAKGKNLQPHADAPEPASDKAEPIGSDDEAKVIPEVRGDVPAKASGGKGSKSTASTTSEKPAPKNPTEHKPQDAKPQDAKPQDAKPQDAKPQDAKPQDAPAAAAAAGASN